MPRFSAIHFTDASGLSATFSYMAGKIRVFLRDETAATAIEYGLIAAGVSLAIIGVTKNLGVKLNSTFTSISSSLK